MELQYLSSFYKNDNDTIHFVRIVSDSTSLRKIRGTISFNSNYNTNQEISLDEKIVKEELKGIENEMIKSGFRKKFDNKRNVMFVQLKPKSENALEALDLRHSVESEIENLLSINGLGEWIAGDLGPGGANMLFEIDDWDNSFQLIIGFLNSKGFINNCLITKRLYTADNDWNYEIVYPINYEGIFNQM